MPHVAGAAKTAAAAAAAGAILGLAAGISENIFSLRYRPELGSVIMDTGPFIAAGWIAGLSLLYGAVGLLLYLPMAAGNAAFRTGVPLRYFMGSALVLYPAGVAYLWERFAWSFGNGVPLEGTVLGCAGLAVGYFSLMLTARCGPWVAARLDPRWPTLAKRLGVAGVAAYLVFLGGKAILEFQWLDVQSSIAPPVRAAIGGADSANGSYLGGIAAPGGILAGSESGGTAQPINVLLITVDTLRADALGSSGNTQVKTPNMDLLAAQGARFDRAYVQVPSTNPSHASILTGTYMETHGVKWHMIDRLRPGVKTLGELMQERGYATGAIYSWTSLEPQYSGLQRGFQSYQGFIVNMPEYLLDKKFALLGGIYRRAREFSPLVQKADEILKAGERLEDELDGRADMTTDGAIRWLRDNGSRPFFFWVHYFDPHYPYSPPAPYDTMYDPDYPGGADGSMATIRRLEEGGELSERERIHVRALYDGEVAFTDRELGRMLRALDEMKLTGRTLVILTGDHGEHFGEHESWTHARGLWEEEIRVPLIMRLPGVIPPGTSVDAPVETIDIPLTILDVTGGPAHPQMVGKTLMSLFRGFESGSDWVAISQLGDDGQLAVLGRDWSIILTRDWDSAELFNVRTDPHQSYDMSSQLPEIVRALAAHVSHKMGDTAPRWIPKAVP